jgi:hypothetical protein
MRLSAPTKLVFWIATAIAILGLLAAFVPIPFVSDNKFWVEFVAFALLWAGAYFKGF